eukprot:g4551.t1
MFDEQHLEKNSVPHKTTEGKVIQRIRGVGASFDAYIAQSGLHVEKDVSDPYGLAEIDNFVRTYKTAITRPIAAQKIQSWYRMERSRSRFYRYVWGRRKRLKSVFQDWSNSFRARRHFRSSKLLHIFITWKTLASRQVSKRFYLERVKKMEETNQSSETSNDPIAMLSDDEEGLLERTRTSGDGGDDDDDSDSGHYPERSIADVERENRTMLSRFHMRRIAKTRRVVDLFNRWVAWTKRCQTRRRKALLVLRRCRSRVDNQMWLTERVSLILNMWHRYTVFKRAVRLGQDPPNFCSPRYVDLCEWKRYVQIYNRRKYLKENASVLARRFVSKRYFRRLRKYLQKRRAKKLKMKLAVRHHVEMCARSCLRRWHKITRSRGRRYRAMRSVLREWHAAVSFSKWSRENSNAIEGRHNANLKKKYFQKLKRGSAISKRTTLHTSALLLHPRRATKCSHVMYLWLDKTKQNIVNDATLAEVSKEHRAKMNADLSLHRTQTVMLNAWTAWRATLNRRWSWEALQFLYRQADRRALLRNCIRAWHFAAKSGKIGAVSEGAPVPELGVWSNRFESALEKQHRRSSLGARRTTTTDRLENTIDLQLLRDRLLCAAPLSDAEEMRLRRMDVNGPEPGTSADMRRTRLHEAALRGETGELRKLLRDGASCVLQDVDGKTPLHLAVERTSKRHVEVAFLLVTHNAPLVLKDKGGRTPVDTAPEGSAIRRFLVDHVGRILRLEFTDQEIRENRRLWLEQMRDLSVSYVPMWRYIVNATSRRDRHDKEELKMSAKFFVRSRTRDPVLRSTFREQCKYTMARKNAKAKAFLQSVGALERVSGPTPNLGQTSDLMDTEKMRAFVGQLYRQTRRRRHQRRKIRRRDELLLRRFKLSQVKASIKKTLDPSVAPASSKVGGASESVDTICADGAPRVHTMKDLFREYIDEDHDLDAVTFSKDDGDLEDEEEETDEEGSEDEGFVEDKDGNGETGAEDSDDEDEDEDDSEDDGDTFDRETDATTAYTGSTISSPTSRSRSTISRGNTPMSRKRHFETRSASRRSRFRPASSKNSARPFSRRTCNTQASIREENEKDDDPDAHDDEDSTDDEDEKVVVEPLVVSVRHNAKRRDVKARSSDAASQIVVRHDYERKRAWRDSFFVSTKDEAPDVRWPNGYDKLLSFWTSERDTLQMLESQLDRELNIDDDSLRRVRDDMGPFERRHSSALQHFKQTESDVRDRFEAMETKREKWSVENSRVIAEEERMRSDLSTSESDVRRLEHEMDILRKDREALSKKIYGRYQK